ncbi:conjugal transfer relaxosome DNA-binding protein TraM [Symbiopectobacterium purcellii]|uniref:conjugal transfer relaxosome DNA-binding protein TraM n=1 Tax=Symbiopectobacterium purcellii TaxID=2871826 RepID=UPI003F87C9AE
MPRVQVYISNECDEKIRAIVQQRRSEGVSNKDVNFSSVASMLLELGLRVYDAQMQKKVNPFNQMEYNKVILENVLKTQMIVSKVLGITSLSPHVKGDENFEFSKVVPEILYFVNAEIESFFPSEVAE